MGSDQSLGTLIHQQAITDHLQMIFDAEMSLQHGDAWTQNISASVEKVLETIDFYLLNIAAPQWHQVLIRLPANFKNDVYFGVLDAMTRRHYSAKLNQPNDPLRPVISENYFGIQITR